jgi:hypothetical protein
MMIGNLKTLSLVGMAICVMGAFGASAAYGQEGTFTADGPVTLTATQTGEKGSNALSILGSSTECSKAIYTGHRFDVTPHEAIPSGRSTATITPHYGSCITTQAGVEFPATFDMNGCDFVLHLEGKSGEDSYAAKTTISCSAGNHVKLTVFSNKTKHEASQPFCTVTLTESEAGYTGLTATDTTNGHIDVAGTIEGIIADKESPTGSILCPKEETKTGILHLDTTVAGANEDGEATPVSLFKEIAVETGRITSTGPVKLTGAQTGAKNENSFTMFGGVTTCAAAKYTGNKVLTEAQTKEEKTHELLPSGSSNVTIVPSYGSCIMTQAGIEFPMTIDTNGCDFELDFGVTTAANKYKVKTTEECPSTQTIKTTIFASAAKHTANEPFCVIDITKQTNRGEGLTATDTLNGSIDITGTVENIVMDRESPTGSILCPKEETKTGILHIDVTVTGDNVGGTATTISLSHT